ncbi:MAG: hypothetical protein HRT98_03385 [Mycoplasmatales bacterium]|nr:hypothetical protein [Mycoplasmatales bacterium]
MNKQSNRGTGAGGANTNLNGLKWERDTNIGDLLKKYNYDLNETPELIKINKKTKTKLYEIHKDKKLVGFFGQQAKIYKMFAMLFPDKLTNEYIELVLSKKINPDGFIYNHKTKTLHIFEKKWQDESGSVDEKLQTAPFKREMFKKLLSNISIEVTYQYILSNFFGSQINKKTGIWKYKNVQEYYDNLNSKEDSNKYGIWIQDKNLKELDPRDFLKDE